MEIKEVVFVIAFAVLLILVNVGSYRAGYSTGYLKSHKIVLDMNRNFLEVVKINKNYERQLQIYERLDQIRQERKSNGR